jgi:hypothetical protein
MRERVNELLIEVSLEVIPFFKYFWNEYYMKYNNKKLAGEKTKKKQHTNRSYVRFETKLSSAQLV